MKLVSHWWSGSRRTKKNQICIENTGLKVLGRRILWLKPNGQYDKLNLEEYTNLLIETLSQEKFLF